MSDSDPKFDPREGLGAVYKDGEVASDWDDMEPLLTPKQLRMRHLFGIPIVSAIKNPWTGVPDIIDDPQLDEMIKEAVALAELESGIDIFTHKYKERHEFDRPEADSFGYIRLRHLPGASLVSMKVESSNGASFWDIPNQWIETGLLHQGQLNVVPFGLANMSGNMVPAMGPGPMGLLPRFFNFNWVPQFWTIEYTTGFKDGRIPKVLNQLIGVIAAMEVLGALATTYARTQSTSLSIDGLSQSISTPGPNLFDGRLSLLGEKRKWLIKKLRHNLGLGIILSNV